MGEREGLNAQGGGLGFSGEPDSPLGVPAENTAALPDRTV